jgi:hypothetical protein
VLKPGKLRNVRSPFLILLKSAQSKLQTGVITQHITLYQARSKLWGYIMIYYAKGARLRYSNQWLSIA